METLMIILIAFVILELVVIYVICPILDRRLEKQRDEIKHLRYTLSKKEDCEKILNVIHTYEFDLKLDFEKNVWDFWKSLKNLELRTFAFDSIEREDDKTCMSCECWPIPGSYSYTNITKDSLNVFIESIENKLTQNESK